LIVADADGSKVITYPTPTEASPYKRIARLQRKERIFSRRRLFRKTNSIKKKKLNFYVNVSCSIDVDASKQCGSDGIGLYQVKQLYMRSSALPAEVKLVGSLRQVLSKAGKQIIAIRLLNIGGDKTFPYLQPSDQNESNMGLRGVRLLLRFPNLLRTQLRAHLRLSDNFHIQILIPMAPSQMTLNAYTSSLKRKA
jgi:phosphoenolpyruvate-protein phosphotransferase (PTS system enzyme I)